jgi:hypothetical protein
MSEAVNSVPGTETLGWGFNIFGPYSTKSKTSLLFDIKDGKRRWTELSTKITYSLPDNVSQPATDNQSPTTTSFTVFDGRSDVQQHFSSKAKLDANLVADFGAFSGSFSAAFSSEARSANQYKYAIAETDASFWEVGLETESLDKLTESVRADIGQLPAAYSISQRGLFFAFFDKYGTHYISSVTVGGRLYYNVAVRKSYTSISDDGKIEAELNYEYLGVFGAKASASAQWKNVTLARQPKGADRGDRWGG